MNCFIPSINVSTNKYIVIEIDLILPKIMIIIRSQTIIYLYEFILSS